MVCIPHQAGGHAYAAYGMYPCAEYIFAHGCCVDGALRLKSAHCLLHTGSCGYGVRSAESSKGLRRCSFAFSVV